MPNPPENNYAPGDEGVSTWDVPAESKVRSLSDMLRFHAMPFTVAVSNLQRAESTLIMRGVGRPEFAKELDVLGIVTDAVDELGQALQDLPVSAAVQEQVKDLHDRIESGGVDSQLTRVTLIALIQAVRKGIAHDLAARLCFMVDNETMKHLHINAVSAYGEGVVDAFPDATRDIIASSQCLALDQWTASVFHSMRVLEHGLRDLAKRVGATFPTSIEVQPWQRIIEKIEKEIRDKQQQLPKGKKKSDTLQFYAEAASQFWIFKEAWRNHVAHTRAHYDKADAMRIYGAVKGLMRQLSKRS